MTEVVESFPVDQVLGDVISALETHGAAVLIAETGAGKTTRLPPALLENGPPGEILVLEPRRLAARLAAERVAHQLNESVGHTVGYTVRFDDKRSDATRLRFLTSGILLQRLPHDPNLEGVSTIVFDEIHERHMADDLLLAWAHRLRQTTRPDLRVVTMSATVNPEPLSRLLDAPVIESKGRTFPVETSWNSRPDDRPIPTQVASALNRLIQDGLDGDVLVFLPGINLIERCMRACQNLAQDAGIDLVTLHGAMSPEETRLSLAPRSRRKVIMSTNIAESSVTLDGVVAVIDTGLHKVARSSPWTGLSSLLEEPIPRNSANQRAGRAGRTAPGQCLRLYTQAHFEQQPESLAPAIRREDIAASVLILATLDVTTVDQLQWLDAPEQARWTAATTLLNQLGGLDSEGRITQIGRQMLNLPVHPRLARLVMDAPKEGAAAAALLSEGARLPENVAAGESDVQALIDLWRSRKMHPTLSKRVKRVNQDLVKKLKNPGLEHPLSQALLHAFPDRVAKRQGDRLLFADGGDALVDSRSVVKTASWVVVIDAVAGRRTFCRTLCEIEPDWLIDLPHAEEHLSEQIEVSWDERSERVTANETLRWKRLILNSASVNAKGRPETTALLKSKARSAGLKPFTDPDALERLRDRRQFAHSVEPSIPPLDDDAIWRTMESLCDGCASFKELKQANVMSHLVAQLNWNQQQQLDALAPERLKLASGRHARVRYMPEGPPRIAARIQDFFGMSKTPTLGGGRITPVLELLAPNMRPAQLTDDLAGFWERTWPQVRKELRGRYPKHAWPEDPTVPLPPKKKRS